MRPSSWPKQELRHECQRKHAWCDIPLTFTHYFILFIVLFHQLYNYRFGNRSNRFFKGLTKSKYQIRNTLWWYQRLNMFFFYLDFLAFQIKKFVTFWLKRWKEKHKKLIFDLLKNSTVSSVFNNSWKMVSFCWTKNPS